LRLVFCALAVKNTLDSADNDDTNLASLLLHKSNSRSHSVVSDCIRGKHYIKGQMRFVDRILQTSGKLR
jgi:hypothetical protein